MRHKEELGIIILAAGRGTRMQSNKPKVLYTINGKSIISYILNCVKNIVQKNIIVVIGYKAEKVKKEISKQFKVVFALQKQLLGTGNAVKVALPYLSKHIKNVVVLCGDVPLIQEKTIFDLINFHSKNQNDITVLSVVVKNPLGYGRVVLDNNKEIFCIKEEVDANSDEKKICLVNSGIYCIKEEFLKKALDLLRLDNVQKEYYLTDIVGIGRVMGRKIGCMIGNNHKELIGINTITQLQQVEQIMMSL
ncbi:MAG: nucleoside-diphosphate-sugar pyrophosphorylase [Desulfobacteraceae bacterium 4572_130]|nr:MAG: nucleoside-diphosphate-sugar pyrophosphorylase [Desulfobacteraceae bacterium 4572_130]